MIVYFDTSSAIKRYVEEDGSAAVRELIRTAEALASSALLHVELRAALARMLKSARIMASEHEAAKSNIERDWMNLVSIPVNEPVLTLAAELAERRFLKSLDAIHLASALTLHQREEVAMSSWDRALLDAAEAEGMQVVEID